MTVPTDIQDIITRIDINNDDSLVPDPSWPIDKYDAEIKKLLPAFIIANDTSFDYGRSYCYSIYRTNDPVVLDYDQAKNCLLAKKQNGLESIGISISAVSSYILLCYGFLDKNAAETVLSYDAETVWHEEMKNLLQAHFSKQGFRLIPKEIAWIELPTITTDLTDLGETRLQDCLF